MIIVDEWKKFKIEDEYLLLSVRQWNDLGRCKHNSTYQQACATEMESFDWGVKYIVFSVMPSLLYEGSSHNAMSSNIISKMGVKSES